MDRIDIIRDRLQTHIDTELELTPHSLSVSEWIKLEPELPHRNYGWRYPIETLDSFEIHFCPGIIANTTKCLTDTGLNDYLVIVEYLIDLWIANYKSPLSQRIALVEERLWKTNPLAVRFLSSLQLKMLDR